VARSTGIFAGLHRTVPLPCQARPQQRPPGREGVHQTNANAGRDDEGLTPTFLLVPLARTRELDLKLEPCRLALNQDARFIPQRVQPLGIGDHNLLGCAR